VSEKGTGIGSLGHYIQLGSKKTPPAKANKKPKVRKKKAITCPPTARQSEKKEKRSAGCGRKGDVKGPISAVRKDTAANGLRKRRR